MPKWIIKHTDHRKTGTFISHDGAYISCTLSNGINASLGYAGLRTDDDYEHRYRLLHMEADEALAYVRQHGHGGYEIFSSEKTWVDRLDGHIAAIRAMGCAVIVLTPEDIQTSASYDENDEPLINLEQAEAWLREHMRDVEEVLLGDYWSESISALLDQHPIKETADA